MFGWIESGGGVNKHFSDTLLTDVLLRTSRTDNKVVIGNASLTTGPAAALYVASNSVGVWRAPAASGGWALDVGGNMRVADVNASAASSSNSSATSVTAYSVALGATSNVYLNHLGAIHGDTVFATSLKRRTTTLTAVQLLAWDAATRLLHLNYDYSASLQPSQVLRIKGRYFSVLGVDAISQARTQVLVELGLYFREDAADAFDVLVPGSSVDMDVLSDLPDPGASTAIYVPLRVLSYAYRGDGATVDMDGLLLEPRDGELLRSRQIVLLLHSQAQGKPDPSPNTLMFLDATVLRDDGTVTLTLRTPDGRADIAAAIGPQLQDGSVYLVPTQTQVTTYATESGVLRGQVVSAGPTQRTVLRNAVGLQALINAPGYNLPDAQVLDKFAFVDAAGTTSEQLPATLFSDPRAGLVLQLPTNPTYAAARTNIRYRFTAAPMHVSGAIVSGPTTVVYTLANFVTDLAAYENCFVYIMDFWIKATWRVVSVYANQVKLSLVASADTADVDLQASPPPGLTHPRYVYALPFKYLELTELGNGVADCSVYSSLFIGTRRKLAQGDRLTVAGPVALQNQLMFYDSNSGSTFAQRFAAGSMDLNGSMTLDSNMVRVCTSLRVLGDVTATSYHVASDRRIKQHVQTTDPDRDLQDLLRLQVREFEYKAQQGVIKKGVIAQEVEAAMPAAINRTVDFAPTVCAWATLQPQDGEVDGGCWLHVDRAAVEHAGMQLLDRLRVMATPTSMSHWDVTIDKLHADGDGSTVAIHVHPAIPAANSKEVYVYGTHTSLRMVDYSHMLAVCINSIQALHHRMEANSSK